MSLRIVGGVARGRKLIAPERGTRPTSERAREALFNALAARTDLDGARVLDLYAGTGAVGLEALSRGAAEAVFVEQHRGALTVLRRNVEAVGLPGARVVPSAVQRFLAGAPGDGFDLVFADPPYDTADEEVTDVLTSLLPWLRPEAQVIMERSARSAAPDWSALGYNPGRERRYGGRCALVRSRSMSPSSVRRALCPGSFDPVQNGHLDIIGRVAALYDEVVVAVFINQSKSSLFSVDERLEMLGEVTAPYPNIVIDTFEGLVVDYCRDHDIPVIVKGLRAVSDFDYELQMAQMNRGLAGVDTLFMPTNPENSFLASSLVKEIAKWGGDVSSLVPPNVLERLKERTARSG